MKAASTLRSLLLIAGYLGTRSDESTTVNLNSTPSDISPPEPESVRLLYGESHGISWSDLEVKERQTPLLTHPYLYVYGVDYHYKRNLIFYTSWGAIWRLPMDEAVGDVQGEQIVGEAAGAATLAVDWEHDRVYWTCPATRSVWRSDLEGERGWRDVIKDTGNLTNHNNVVVDPYMRYLFVASDSGYSLRSDLEGDDLEMLYHGLTLASLALDIHNRRLYVSGYRGFAPALQSSDYDGGDVIDYKLDCETDWWVRLMSIDVFSAPGHPPQLFWVHQGWRDRDTAWKVAVADGRLSWQKEYTSSGTVLDPENRIWCVKVYHPDVQTRPEYRGREEPLPPASSEALTDRNATDARSVALSSLLTGECVLLQALSYLVLAVISRQTCV